MDKINIEIPDDIKSFVKDIQERVHNTMDIYIGGGWIRDNYCNLTPKDLDIFIVPKCEGINEVGYVPAKCYVNYNKRVSDLTNTQDMKDRGVSQVVGLFNSKLSTTEIQFIVYDKFLTSQELAADFDMSINQVVYSVEKESIYATDAFFNGHRNKVIECLHDYDPVRTYDRYCRMEQKFTDYEVVGKPSASVLPLLSFESVLSGTYKPRESTGSMVD